MSIFQLNYYNITPVGHLVCRDLTTYINTVEWVTMACQKTTTGGETSTQTGRCSRNDNNNNRESLMLLSSMSFMKLQICYFGNMALRSSLAFAVVGSLLLSLIPIIIKNED